MARKFFVIGLYVFLAGAMAYACSERPNDTISEPFVPRLTAVVDTPCVADYTCSDLTQDQRDLVELVIDDMRTEYGHCADIQEHLQWQLDSGQLITYDEFDGNWGWYEHNRNLLGIWTGTWDNSLALTETLMHEADHANNHHHLGWDGFGPTYGDFHFEEIEDNCFNW